MIGFDKAARMAWLFAVERLAVRERAIGVHPSGGAFADLLGEVAVRLERDADAEGVTPIPYSRSKRIIHAGPLIRLASAGLLEGPLLGADGRLSCRLKVPALEVAA